MSILSRITSGASTLVKNIHVTQSGVLLGRYSSGAGKAQEITLGSGVTVTGGELTVAPAWSDITGKPTEFTPAAHTHTFSSLTSKPTTLAGYGITDAAASTHTHALSSLTQSGAFSKQVAMWSGGNWVPSAVSYLDLTDVPTAVPLTASKVVANAAARLALSLADAEGFAVVEADTGKSYMLVEGGNPATSGDWTQIGDRDIQWADVGGKPTIPTVDNTTVNAAIAEDPAASLEALGLGDARVFYATLFGVTANGITDDTDALQAAIDAAASASTALKRCTVVMPAGTIMVRRTSSLNTHGSPDWKHCIRMRSNVNLVGQGMDATILRIITGTSGDSPLIDAIDEVRNNSTTTNGSPNLTVTTTAGLYAGMRVVGTGIPNQTTVVSITNETEIVMSANATATSSTVSVGFPPTNMSFHDFTADVNSWSRFGTSPGGEGECINLKGGTKVHFQNVKCINAEQDGFDLDGGWDISMIGCVASDCWGSGLHMVADGIHRVTVTNCFFERNGFGRRSSSEGGGGTGANGSGADFMGTDVQFTGCVFRNNAVEVHQLQGYATFVGCKILHSPASTLYPAMNGLPGVIAGWTALGAVGDGFLHLDACTVAASSTNNNVIEVMQTWPKLVVSNSWIYGKAVVTAGKDVTWKNNYCSPLSGVYHAFHVVSATGIIEVDGCRFESYANGVRIDAASNGKIIGNTFTGVSGAKDVHFTVTGTKTNWMVSGNVFSSAATHGIYCGSNFTNGQFLDNKGNTTAGFALLIGGGSSSTGNIVRNNVISTVTVSSGASTGNIFEDNLIMTSIVHDGATTIAGNTWRRNTGSGCSGIFYGTATLSSGTATVTTAAANSARKWTLTRQAKGSSSAIGSLSIGTVTAQTSFVVDALKADATVETGDSSSVFWRIEE